MRSVNGGRKWNRYIAFSYETRIFHVLILEVTYAWYKNDQSNWVRPQLKHYIFISHDGGLYFSETTTDDKGEYYCMVSKPGTTRSSGANSMPTRLNVIEGSKYNFDTMPTWPWNWYSLYEMFNVLLRLSPHRMKVHRDIGDCPIGKSELWLKYRRFGLSSPISSGKGWPNYGQTFFAKGWPNFRSISMHFLWDSRII